MRNPQQRTRRIPAYVTTQEDHVIQQAQSENFLVMGLLIASVVLGFLGTVFSIANLVASKSNRGD